jgi:outer membrane murein-binding lipoprotein Lpp
MRKTLRTISLPLVIGGVFTLTMATGCTKEQTIDTSACSACASNASRVDAAASRAEAAASRAEAAAQRAEAASQKAEAMFGKSIRK